MRTLTRCETEDKTSDTFASALTRILSYNDKRLGERMANSVIKKKFAIILYKLSLYCQILILWQILKEKIINLNWFQERIERPKINPQRSFFFRKWYSKINERIKRNGYLYVLHLFIFIKTKLIKKKSVTSKLKQCE